MSKAVSLRWQLQLHFKVALFILLLFYIVFHDVYHECSSIILFPCCFQFCFYFWSMFISFPPFLSWVLPIHGSFFQLSHHLISEPFFASDLHFSKLLEILMKYLVTTYHCFVAVLFVCSSWCYLPAPFLLLDFSIFVCRSVMVPLGLLLFEWGELLWIRRHIMWVNAMLQDGGNLVRFLSSLFLSQWFWVWQGYAWGIDSFATLQRDCFLQIWLVCFLEPN